VQRGLGIPNAAAFDILAACSGFIYGLSIAKGYIESGMYKNVLLIGAETLSKINRLAGQELLRTARRRSRRHGVKPQ